MQGTHRRKCPLLTSPGRARPRRMRAAVVLAAVACAVASPALSAAPRPALRPQLRRLALLRGGGAVAKPALPAADSSYDLLPHSRSATECLTHFGVDPQQGLSEERAAELARRYGPNALEVEAGPSALALFLGQFEDRLVQVRPGPSRSPSPGPGPSATLSHRHGLHLRLSRASLPRCFRSCWWWRHSRTCSRASRATRPRGGSSRW